MIALLSRLWSLVAVSKFFILFIRHRLVLEEAFGSVSEVLAKMNADKRALPDHSESQVLVMAVSNILKTGIIDLPGVDEYQIAIGLDNINQNMVLSIQDSKSGQFHKIPVLGKGK